MYVGISGMYGRHDMCGMYGMEPNGTERNVFMYVCLYVNISVWQEYMASGLM